MQQLPPSFSSLKTPSKLFAFFFPPHSVVLKEKDNKEKENYENTKAK